MYNNISIQALSKSQIIKLLNGQKVIVKYGQGIEIQASEEQYKKIIKAHEKGSRVTIQFDTYQMQNHQFLREQDHFHLKDDINDATNEFKRVVHSLKDFGVLSQSDLKKYLSQC